MEKKYSKEDLQRAVSVVNEGEYLLGTPKVVFSALQHHLKSGE
jgi:hypothetical protein